MTALLARLRRPAAPARPEELTKRLEKADRLIDLAWSVAVLWGVMRLVAALWLWRNTAADDPAWFADPLLIGVLAYGLYRRSRACAILLLLYVVVELRLTFGARGPTAGITVALVLGITFAQGIRGAYAYRKEMGDAGLR
ncbi:MAG TPA: hypothetical protein VEX86_07340 [Longimicrobium sp.]|nr:hypothetical protein [Longimicrobium sp.]